jgi:hypothetical protein
MSRVEDPAVRQPTRTDGYESVAVNRYLWYASLDVLSFLPVESADPFSGVIVTGYGVPPGGSAAYRATIYVSDPALDARALNVALFTRSGAAVAAETAQAGWPGGRAGVGAAAGRAAIALCGGFGYQGEGGRGGPG